MSRYRLRENRQSGSTRRTADRIAAAMRARDKAARRANLSVLPLPRGGGDE